MNLVFQVFSMMGYFIIFFIGVLVALAITYSLAWAACLISWLLSFIFPGFKIIYREVRKDLKNLHSWLMKDPDKAQS